MELAGFEADASQARNKASAKPNSEPGRLSSSLNIWR